MSISNSLNKNIDILCTLNPQKSTLVFNTNSNSLESKERSFKTRILNFFRWCIHKIKCSRIPLNPKLDKITCDIFNNIDKELKNNNSKTNKEKKSLEKAIQNLQTIIKKDHGAHEHKAKALLVTINNIKALDPVQNLEDPKESNKVQKPTEAETSQAEATVFPRLCRTYRCCF